MSSKMPSGHSELYPPEFFRRNDESDDALFYEEPRPVVHIDEHAIEAIGIYFRDVLPENGVILDLMSSWRSHLPEDFPKKKLVGLGMNAVELSQNPQLDSWLVHNLNENPRMPLKSETFDAAVVTVSIQYMIRPLEIFADVNRVLRQGGIFHVIYSNRMFPTKATAAWQALDDSKRAQLIASYFVNSGEWEAPKARDVSPNLGFYTDPVYVVSAAKSLTKE